MDRVSEGDVLRHQADVVEPLHRRLAVPAQAVGLLHRRLQRVHVDLRHARRCIDNPPREALGKAVRPRRREQDARFRVVVLFMQVGEQREVIRLDLRLVVMHARPGPLLQLGWQRRKETELVERQFGLVAHAGRKGEADAGIEVDLDRGMRAAAAERAIIVEAVVMQQRAPGANVVIRGHAGAELGRQEVHVRPVEERVLEEIVLHAFLDRRHAAAVAVRVDQARHEELSTVAEDARPWMLALDIGKGADRFDAPALYGDRGIAQHALLLAARIGQHMPAAHEQRFVHRVDSSRTAARPRRRRPPPGARADSA